MSVLGNASGCLLLRAEELPEILLAAWVTLASDLVDIPAALAAVILVRRITELQEQAARPLGVRSVPLAG